MIRYKSNRQLSLEGIDLTFGGQLSQENRWVKWSQVIPWDELAVGYYRAMGGIRGIPMVIGAVIINYKLNLSDEETLQEIQENPYLQ